MAHTRPRGCWTCRLRRKRCDGEDPCRDCRSLGIDCCFQINKPDWMVRGAKQRQRAEEIKSQIRHNASQRRTQHKVQTLTQQLKGASILTDDGSPPKSPQGASTADSSVSSGYDVSKTVGGDSLSTSSSPEVASLTAGFRPAPQPEQAQQLLEGVLQMAYLDYLFPIIYPFYRTGLAGGGRCWIFPVLLTNTCVRHGITALSSHLLSRVQDGSGSSTQLCEVLDARHLHLQTQTALQSAQESLKAVQSKDTDGDALETSKMLCSMIQLLTVEAHMGTQWKIHLDAAVSLLKHLITGFSFNKDPGEALELVIDDVGSLFVLQRPQPPLFTPDQSSFRFYAAKLVFADCLASTALEQEPQLREYSRHLLKGSQAAATSSKLDIAEIFGVADNTVLLISEIAALAAWRKAKVESQCLSIPELVHEAGELEVMLQRHLDELEAAGHQPDCRQSLPIDLLAGRAPIPRRSADTIKRIWALAARSYLLVTVSGVQLSQPELRASVSETLDLLEFLIVQEVTTVPAWLRALAWPICVTGLLVQSTHEKQFLRRLFNSLEPLASFMTVRCLKETLERTWEQRKNRGSDHPVHGATLGSLMGGVLLI